MPDVSPPPRPDPQIFLIGFNRSGGAWFKTVFEAAGLTWRHDRTGELAVDLAHAEATGRVPFEPWPRLCGISGLERWNRPDLPRLEGAFLFRYLAECFPRARFILNDRDPADWIASRYFWRDGRFRALEAWHRGVEEADLPEIWLKERAAHIARVCAFFGDSARLLRFNVSHDPDEKLVDWAAPWQRLGPLPALREIERPRESLILIDMLAEEVAEAARRARPRRGAPDMAFVDAVVAHAVGPLRRGLAPGDDAALSPAAALWQADGSITGRDGAALPLAAGPDGRYLAQAQEQRLDRVQGVVNGMLALGLRPPVSIDMQDAREVGVDGPGPVRPTLVYNRRAGAANLVLWPLPFYHMLAPVGRPGGYAPDPLEFDEKADACVWVGNLTGRVLRSLLPGRGPARLAHQVLRELAGGVAPDRRAEIAAELRAIPRYRVVSRLFGAAGFDLGFVLPPQHAVAGRDPLIAPHVTRRRPEDWFHGAKYVLSLSGNDTGSNFLPGVASNTLVLKEEDGWELFYTAAFRPWEHYVPLAPGADDLEHRLDWARSHPRDCAAMVAAASALYAKFTAPENREAWLRAVHEEVSAA